MMKIPALEPHCVANVYVCDKTTKLGFSCSSILSRELSTLTPHMCIVFNVSCDVHTVAVFGTLTNANHLLHHCYVAVLQYLICSLSSERKVCVLDEELVLKLLKKWKRRAEMRPLLQEVVTTRLMCLESRRITLWRDRVPRPWSTWAACTDCRRWVLTVRALRSSV